ncbi:MAG: hypothetical protein GY834_16990 [Bacteroidetes bacterium]|nr:hypothetical protein [Bacteroidota bacterium]
MKYSYKVKQLIFIFIASFLASISQAEEYIELGQDWAKEYAEKVLNQKIKNIKPESGYVPDKETAISIAVSVWNPIYGSEKIKKEAPYFAYQVDNVWVVTGSLPKGWKGGTAKAVISKDTGQVLHIIHYK